MKIHKNGIKKFAAPLGLAMVAMATASGVQAAHLTIDDSVENEVTISHHYFEGGITVNGTYYPHVTGPSRSNTVAGEIGTAVGSWIANTNRTGSGIIYIVEPGTEKVLDKIEASWSQNGYANIDLTFTSSACGIDLGDLPSPGFPSVDDPDVSADITGSFVDTVTGASVKIPSHLGMTFVSSGDSDCDGVINSLDSCPGTTIPEVTVPSSETLGINRFALTDGDDVFDTVSPNGEGPSNSYTLQNTGGCSCEQIIDKLDLGQGQTKKGCSNSNMESWINSLPQ